jgi:hypothetical protein
VINKFMHRITQSVIDLFHGNNSFGSLNTVTKLGLLYVARFTFPIGATGGADDVVLIPVGTIPFAGRIVDVQMHVTTLHAAATGTLRTRAAGAGVALSSDLSAAGNGVVRSAVLAAPGATFAMTDGFYLRRNDDPFAGTVTIYFTKASERP